MSTESPIPEAENGRRVLFPRQRRENRPIRVFTWKQVAGFVVTNMTLLLGFGFWVVNSYVDQRIAFIVRVHNTDSDAHSGKLATYSIAASADRQAAKLEAQLDRLEQKVQELSEQIGEMRGEMRARAREKER